MNEINPVDSDDPERRENWLLHCIVNGDQEALEQLYNLYYPRLSRFLLRILGASGQQSLPGLINEVMFVVWNKATTFNQTSKVSSWIFGIALRLAKKHQSTQFNYDSRHQQLVSDETTVTEPWEAHLENTDLLNKAIQNLSQEHRAVIELTYFNGLHYSEIATIMRCPENTVKTRMYHARQRLEVLIRDLESSTRSG